MYTPPAKVRFGAAYYNEYQETSQLKRDLDLMVEASFSVIRVGESVWSTWEPENGVFDLAWLLPVLDGALEKGLEVIIGTPTYAVPPWLARTYPEIAGERGTGQRIPWGARQEVDFTHPAFRFHAERVIREIVVRYAEHPAVVGFQVDNEPGNELLYNHGVFQRFVDWLRQRYGDVETINREWGLTHWSHRLSTWADLWTPDGNAQPQYDLAWRQFQALQTTEFIEWQAAIVRDAASPHHFVTTCMAYDRPAFDDRAMAAGLDVAAGNPYYTMQDALALPYSGDREQNWTTHGTWSLYLSADRMYSSKQSGFLVTETNAQSIGHSWTNAPAFDGQWRQVAWTLVSRGAEMIEYWHWDTLRSGAETYWGGVLPHSGRPSRAYREIARLGRELDLAGSHVTGLTPDADVGFIYSANSRWALEAQPALAGGDGGPDRRSYQGIFDPFYRGAFDAKLQTRVLHIDQLHSRRPEAIAATIPVLVAPAVYVASDEQLEWLHDYAKAGGHLVLGPRSAYADHEARARPEVAPARLHHAAGVWYDEFSNLALPLPVRVTQADLDGCPPINDSVDAQATRWVDGLVPTTATVMASYQDRHFGQFPAVTTQQVGLGRISVVGTVPNPAFAETLFIWFAELAGRLHSWRSELPTVTITGARNARGEQLRFLHNWSWEPATFVLPCGATDLLSAEDLSEGESIRLGSWDVRVLVERAAATGHR